MDYTSKATEDMESTFEVEEAWEFSAPMYYDFLAPPLDDLVADVWFDTKFHDDISPEIDEEEFEVQHDFGSAPPTPSASHTPYSVPSTPMTPHWHSRVEERSPQREDAVMGRHIVDVMRTSAAVQPMSPVRIYTSHPNSTPTKPVARESSVKPKEVASQIAPASTTSANSNQPSTQAPVFKTKLFTMPVPPTTLGTVGRPTAPVSKIPAAPANPAPTRPNPHTVPVKQPGAPASKRLPLQTVQKSNTQLQKDVPIKRLPFASQRSVVAPIRTGPTSSNSKTEQALQQSATEASSMPRFMAPTLSQLGKNKSTKTSTANTSQKVPAKTLYETRAQIYQTKALSKRQTMIDKENLVNGAQVQKKTPLHQAKQHSPSGKKRSLGAKATPNTLRTLREQHAKPLTLAVTPDFMKRRVARIRPEQPRLTTEQLRTIEAERARREFLAELHRKNMNRGLAPRVNFDAQRNVQVGGQWR